MIEKKVEIGYNWGMELSRDSLSVLDELTKVRRDLHLMPEKSKCEEKTSAYIKAYLAKLGLKFKTSHTGVFCDILGEDKSKTIALRCDFDALPIEEKTKVSYASKNGCMHACGHDGHTAILLVLASLLKKQKPKTNVRLIFQFGEEGEGGAETMINDGVLEGIDEIYALHVDPSLDKGRLSTIDGAMFAGTVEFNVEFLGKAAHCAEPSKGIDAIKAMSHFLLNAVNLNEKYKNNSLFHIGTVKAGVARNVIADRAKVECSLRYFDNSAREDIMMNTARLLDECKNLFKTEYDLTVENIYIPVVNSCEAVKKVRTKIDSIEECLPRYTAEDFGMYLEKVGGCMVWLGIRDEEFSSPLHSSNFGFNEDALLYGLEFFLKLLDC